MTKDSLITQVAALAGGLPLGQMLGAWIAAAALTLHLLDKLDRPVS